jgi:hypothetical protein
MRQQLVAAESAEHGEYAGHLRVGERRVQVGDPRRHRRGLEVVTLVDVIAERQPQAQDREAGVDDGAVIVLGHERAAEGGRHHAYGVAAAELARDERAGRDHRVIVPRTPGFRVTRFRKSCFLR